MILLRLRASCLSVLVVVCCGMNRCTTLDGQTDCFKIDRICLSVVNHIAWPRMPPDGWMDNDDGRRRVHTTTTRPPFHHILRTTAREREARDDDDNTAS